MVDAREFKKLDKILWKILVLIVFRHVADAYTKKNTVLAMNYFLVIDLNDGDELGVAIFETHTIPNVNESNQFYFAKDDAEITIPECSYEVWTVNEFLKHAILQKWPCRDALETIDVVRDYNNNYDISDDDDDDDEGGEYPPQITTRCEIRCAYRINFVSPTSLDRCWDSRRSIYCSREDGTNRMYRST